MLLIATSMIGGFIFAALLSGDIDDDDNGPDGGLMTPVLHQHQIDARLSTYRRGSFLYA